MEATNKLNEAQKAEFDAKKTECTPELERASAVRSDLLDELRQVENELKRTEDELRRTEDELRRAEGSIRYRIGNAFVDAAKPSMETLRLPGKLRSLLKERNEQGPQEVSEYESFKFYRIFSSDECSGILDALQGRDTEASAEFMGSQFSDIREEIANNLYDCPESRDKKNILYVLHDSGGGTPQTNKDLMSSIQNNYNCYVLTSCGKYIKLSEYSDGELTTLLELHMPTWDIREFSSPEFINVYVNVLINLNISLVHIRHLVSHSLDLPKIADIMGIPVILSFHDFYFVCPSINLINGDGVYCSAICETCEKKCVSHYGWISDHVPDLRGFLELWRTEVEDMFSHCTAFVTTSEVVKSFICGVFPSLIDADFRVIEHGRDFEPVDYSKLSEAPVPGEKIKVLILGNLEIIKGSDFIKEIQKLDKEQRLEFHFSGSVAPEIEEELDGVFHGGYSRIDLKEIIESIKPAFAGIFSICPETYCHTLSEVWDFGIPTFVSDIGVLRERTLNGGAGWLVDVNDPEGSYNKMIEVVSNSDEYDRVREATQKIIMRTIDEMASDYLQLYLKYMQIEAQRK